MIIKFRKDFKKDSKKLSTKTKEKLRERLMLFEKDKFDPTLNNHSLKGKYLGFRSINVTGDLRAIYKSFGENVIFFTLDSHSNLYR